jgi:predicted RNase H-like HicB family nuclease
MKSMKLPILYSNDGRSWAATTPLVPGAFGQGETKAEAKGSLISAIQDLVAINKEIGLRSPFEKITLSVEVVRV